MVYVYFKRILADTIPKYVRLNKTEAKILDTLITMKNGNAYKTWKASGLKHYPTVLRTLKKLEEKRLVKIFSESGTRGERIYVPTLVGTLVSYIFNGQEKKIVKMVEENSSLFRELYKIDREDSWAFLAVQDIIIDAYRTKEFRSFDEAIENRVEGFVVDKMMDAVFNKIEGAMDWILKISKIRWIREIVVRLVESEKTKTRQAIDDLDELSRKLEQLHWKEQYSREEKS